MRRHIVLTTDDSQEAVEKLKEKKKADLTGKEKWAMADVRQMLDPPMTVFKYAVFRIIED